MSDSDSDLALSAYDVEDSLNFYGSPVHGLENPSAAGALVATTSAELAQTSERTQVHVEQIFLLKCLDKTMYIKPLLVNTNLFFSFVAVKIHAVDEAGRVKGVVHAATKI